MTTSITFEIGAYKLSHVNDGYLAELWHHQVRHALSRPTSSTQAEG